MVDYRNINRDLLRSTTRRESLVKAYALVLSFLGRSIYSTCENSIIKLKATGKRQTSRKRHSHFYAHLRHHPNRLPSKWGVLCIWFIFSCFARYSYNNTREMLDKPELWSGVSSSASGARQRRNGRILAIAQMVSSSHIHCCQRFLLPMSSWPLSLETPRLDDMNLCTGYVTQMSH